MADKSIDILIPEYTINIALKNSTKDHAQGLSNSLCCQVCRSRVWNVSFP